MGADGSLDVSQLRWPELEWVRVYQFRRVFSTPDFGAETDLGVDWLLRIHDILGGDQRG